MFKVAVIDDEYTVAAQIERLLVEVCEEWGLETEVDVFCSGEEMIQFLESGNRFLIRFNWMEYWKWRVHLR